MSNSEPSKVMDDDQKITINTVDGGEDGGDLKGCYFLPNAPFVYTFYNQDGSILATNVSSGCSFTFTLNNLNWMIGKFGIADGFKINPQTASGNWSIWNNDIEQESGTFTAVTPQASGGVGDEERSTSSSTA